jgi:hypothetical protein
VHEVSQGNDTLQVHVVVLLSSPDFMVVHQIWHPHFFLRVGEVTKILYLISRWCLGFDVFFVCTFRRLSNDLNHA